MELLFAIARFLGTDPVSLIVHGLLSGVSAYFMQRLVGSRWLGFLAFPVFLAGALLADDVAAALDFYPAISIRDSGSLTANLRATEHVLPSVLLAGLVGMMIAGGLLLAVARCFGN